MTPSMKAVEAAIAAWNRAEPQSTISSYASWVTTFAEMLEAAYAVDVPIFVDEAVDAAIEGATTAVSKAFASGQIVAGPNPRNAPRPGYLSCGCLAEGATCENAPGYVPRCDPLLGTHVDPHRGCIMR